MYDGRPDFSSDSPDQQTSRPGDQQTRRPEDQQTVFLTLQRQMQITGWIPTFGPMEERIEELYAGEIELNGLINTLTIRFRTDMQKKSLLLNRIIFVRKPADP